MFSEDKIEDKEALREAQKAWREKDKAALLRIQNSAEEKGHFFLARQAADWRKPEGADDEKRFSKLIFDKHDAELVGKGEYAAAAFEAKMTGMSNKEIGERYMQPAAKQQKWKQVQDICGLVGDTKGAKAIGIRK